MLTYQNYVGVICLPDGDQIEIFPKTHNSEQALKASSRQNLVKMLRATRHLPSITSSTASLDIARMPLLDVFIQLFLNEVGKLVKRGITRQYQTQQENIAYLKGS